MSAHEMPMVSAKTGSAALRLHRNLENGALR